MPTIQINSNMEKKKDNIDELLDLSESKFVFYKITQPKSCNKKTPLLYSGLIHETNSS